MSDLLSSLDVVNKAFKKTMRGYDSAEVDEFLDRVAESIQSYVQRIKDYEKTIEEQSEKIADFENLKNSLHEALLMAQRTAEEKLANATKLANERLNEANTKVSDIQAEARVKADRVIKEAEERAEKITQEARDRSDRMIRDSEEQLVALGSEIKKLQQLREDAFTQLRSFVSDVDRTVASAESGGRIELSDMTQDILRKHSGSEETPRLFESQLPETVSPSFDISDPEALPTVSSSDGTIVETKRMDISETLAALGIDPSLMSAEIK